MGLLALVASLTGCGVATSVTTTVDVSGSGRVAVTVAFDRAATTVLGDGGIDTAGLDREGWTVRGPRASAAGGTVVSATHPFASVGQIPGLLAEVVARPAGFSLVVAQRGPPGARVTTASGEVDLTCGVNCFGDAALGRVTGSDVGAPDSLTPAEAAADLTFSFSLTLPGTLRSTNAGSRSGARLTWRVPLGQSRPVRAESVTGAQASSSRPGATLPSPSGPTVSPAGVGAGVAVLVVAAAIVVLVRFRRRRTSR